MAQAIHKIQLSFSIKGLRIEFIRNNRASVDYKMSTNVKSIVKILYC